MLGIVGKQTDDAGSPRAKLIKAVNAGGTPGKNNTKTASNMVTRVLQAAFGVGLGERSGRDLRCNLDTTLYQALVDKYKCGCLADEADVNPFVGFAMVDGDELSSDGTVPVGEE